MILYILPKTSFSCPRGPKGGSGEPGEPGSMGFPGVGIQGEKVSPETSHVLVVTAFKMFVKCL